MQDIFPNAERAAAAPAAEPDRAVTLRDVELVLRRRRRLVAAVAAGGAALTIMLAVQSVPQYTASAQILIEQQTSPIASQPGPRASAASDAAMISTEVGIIRSRQHVSDVMSDLGLFDDPAVRAILPAAEDSLPARFHRLADAVTSRLPERWLMSAGIASSLPARLEAEPADEARMRREAVDLFSSRLSTLHEAESRLVSVQFTFPDPELAARVVNRAAGLYLQRQVEMKRADSRATLDWLQQRLAQMEAELRASEDKLESYRARNDLIRAPDAPSEGDTITQLNQSLSQARVTAVDLESRLRSVREHRNDPEALVSMFQTPILVKLREQELGLARDEAELVRGFGERHPRMLLLRAEKERVNQKLMQEVGLLVSDLEQQVRAAHGRVEQLQAQLGSVRSRDELRSEAQVGLRQLEREATADRGLYEHFLQRYREMSEQVQIMAADGRIVSYAQPPSRPSSLSPRLFGLIGLTLSLGGGALMALLVDGLDRRVRSARQIERLFGLKVLDSVPQLARGVTQRAQFRYLLQKPLSAYAESLRSIFTALQLSASGSPPQVVVVSSALSGEGKTSFALSLAASAAQWGKRVLVVDLDVRHPRVAQSLGDAHVESGLAELMAGMERLDEVIRTSRAGFDYIGVGRAPVNPAGFIGNVWMQALFTELRRSYDFIIIDTAPLLAVTDGRVAVKLADKVLFVVRWRHTPVSAARKALQILAEIGADIAGTALLQVDAKQYLLYDSEDGANYHSSLKKYYVN